MQLNLIHPLIMSFEYVQKNNIINNVISYINTNDISSVSIIGLPPLSIIKRINSDNISIDVDYFQLDSKSLLKLKAIAHDIHQIRIIVNEVYEYKTLEKYCKKISKLKKNRILFYSFYNVHSTRNIKEIVNLANKYGFIPSFLPLKYYESHKKNLINIFNKYKKEIKHKEMFLDSPEIESEIMQTNVICPAVNLSLHIDINGSIKICSFDSEIYGNIQNDLIDNIRTDIKIKLGKKNFGKCCILNNYRKPYDIFSKVYDKLMVWAGNLYQNYYDHIITNFLNNDIKILDIACGSGTLINKLAEKYPNIQGLDTSEEICRIARKKTNKKIFSYNMIDFDLNQKYDLLICTFDSINYIYSIQDLKIFAKNIYLHLNNGGTVLFDINSLFKFRKHYNKIEKFKIDDYKIKVTSSYLKPYWQLIIEMFNKNESNKEIHIERFYKLSDIISILEDVGFTQVNYFNGGFNCNIFEKNRYFFHVLK